MHHFSFNRPYLAVAYCDSLVGKGIANATSGLFLAGPRRVGKSTFLKEDLIPEAEKRSWTVVYVDLWSNKNADPAMLIIEAIKTALAAQESKTSKLVKRINLSKITLMNTFVIDLAEPGLPENMTLTDAIRLLGELAEKPVLLVIDEAQHALTTTDGLNTMFAIKSARDQINVSHGVPSLMLVFTGSNRDKLAHLVLKKEQPFFGSDVTAFPLLGIDYTDAFTQWANKSLASNNQFTNESMWQAFQLVGHRPEILRQIAGKIAISGNANHLTQLLEEDAFSWHSRIWEEFENDFNALTPLQQSILKELIKKERAFAPFSEESLHNYKESINQSDLSVASVQTAIHVLRERGFIWQSGRGAYSLEDEGFAEWYKHCREKN